MPLNLVVISPEKEIINESCTQVTLPGEEGELTVLAGHIPLFCLLKAGELIFKNDKTTTTLGIGDGFAKITPESVSVLTSFGVHDAELDEETIKKAKQKAEDIIKSHTDEKNLAFAQATLARAILELKIVSRRKKV